MENKTLKQLLNTFLGIYSQHMWIGWRKGAEPKNPLYARSSCRGSFTAYRAYMEQYEVIMIEHDYAHQGKIHRDVKRRRDIPEGVLTWIEIEINDPYQRTGLAHLTHYLTICPSDHCYELAKTLYDRINLIGYIPGYGDRLNQDQAIRSFCKSVRGHQ